MKFRTTKKAMREYAHVLISIPYCDAWHLLRGIEPFAYNSGVYGWNCDYYETDGVIICTGYRPHGFTAPYEITRKYEKLAKQAFSTISDWRIRENVISTFRTDWINEIVKSKE